MTTHRHGGGHCKTTSLGRIPVVLPPNETVCPYKRIPFLVPKENVLHCSPILPQCHACHILTKNKALSILPLHLSMIRRWWSQGIKKSNLPVMVPTKITQSNRHLTTTQSCLQYPNQELLLQYPMLETHGSWLVM